MSKTGKFLLGALVGAAAAALLTPLTGKEARGELAKLSRRTKISPARRKTKK